MFIKKIYLKNDFEGYIIEETSLSRLNVLVGVSGAGKTSFIRAISLLKSVSDGESQHGVEWSLDLIDNENNEVTWSGKYSKKLYMADGEFKNFILNEKIIVNKKLVLTRTKDKTTLNGTELPALDHTQSSLFTLRNESQLKVIHSSLESVIIIGDVSRAHAQMSQMPTIPETEFKRMLSEIANHPKDGKLEISTLNCRVGIYLNEKFCRDKFEEFEFVYKSIFPTVESIVPQVKVVRKENNLLGIFIEIKLKSGETIQQQNISSGMFKTMMILAELMLSEKESLIAIDEIENGLGVNCLPDIIDQINESNKQVIISSHHPRVIDGISLSNWKIVTRKNKSITVTNASEVIDTKSSHDNFIKLINNKIYMDGNKV